MKNNLNEKGLIESRLYKGNKSYSLIKNKIESYDLIDNFKELSADKLIEAAMQILNDKSVFNNKHVAIKFLERAVQKGSSKAKFIIAKMYYRGLYTQKDYQKAAMLFKELADEGNIQAKRFYADMIYYSRVEDKEREDCIKIYQECASSGDLVSKYRLANIYRNGDFTGKPNYEMALLYYENCLNSEYDEKTANMILSACCTEAMHCELENFYLKEANAARNYDYYKRRPSVKKSIKKYFEYAEKIKEYMPLDDRISFENSLAVYRLILKDDSLDISKISYGEFRNRYYNKHPRIFLTTKKTEYLIYKQGLRNYFLMRDDAAEELEHEVEEKQKHAQKQKVVVKKVVFNLNLSNVAGQINASTNEIEESVDKSVESFKNSYNVDYSLCVANLDKYLEEIIYQIFVVGLNKYKQDKAKEEINEIVDQIKNELTTPIDLDKLAELIIGDISKIPAKNYKRIVEKFINDILSNKQGTTTANQIEAIKNYFNEEESISASEDFLINDILYLYEKCAALREIKTKETFTFGELFDITFVDKLGDDTKPNMLKAEILDYVLKISGNKDVQEVYLKLNELILKIEHFRVMVRNIASHKSILTQNAIENGLNICVTQNTSIFNLLDELFGNYLEKQTMIEESKKFLSNAKFKIDDAKLEEEVSIAMKN